MLETAYIDRLRTSIELQCSRRGVPPEEVGSFVLSIEAAAGKTLAEMSSRELARVQSNIDAHFRRYLEGAPER